MIFEGGAAGNTDTVQTAHALFFYAFGLCGYSAIKITTDGFYAFQDTKTPAVVSVATIALNISLNYLFIFHFGLDHRSLALSTAITITLNFAVLFFMLQRKATGLVSRALVLSLAKILVGTLLMALAAYWALQQTQAYWGDASLLAQSLAVLLPIIVALVVFGVAAWLLRVDALLLILGKVRRKR